MRAGNAVFVLFGYPAVPDLNVGGVAIINKPYRTSGHNALPYNMKQEFLQSDVMLPKN
jgi:hypothetical protein